MNPRRKCLIAAIAIACFAAACAVNHQDREGGTAIVPSCAGQFCFSEKLKTKDELVAEFGAGYSEDGRFPYHCYEAESGGPYVRFRSAPGKPAEIIDIFVSDRLSCASAKPPTRTLGTLATDGGLQLGDSRIRVIELYGAPTRESVADDLEMLGSARGVDGNRQPFGDTQMFYYAKDPETLHAIIFLRSGVVSAILISRSE